MTPRIYILLALWGFVLPAKAWETNRSVGALSTGMANVSLLNKDVWSVFNNPSLMSFNSQTAFGIYAKNSFGVSNLNSGAIVFNYVNDLGAVGGYVLSSGNVNYNDYQTGISFSKKLLDEFHLGLSVFYTGLYASDYGTFGTVAFNLSAMFPFNKKLIGAVKINNPIKQKIAELNQESLYSGVGLGFSYLINEELNFYSEAEVMENFPIDFKCGFEYSPRKDFIIRTGFSTLRNSIGFGLTFERNIRLVFGFNYHNNLGVSSSFDTQYYFGYGE